MIANQAIRKLAQQYFRLWGDYNDPLVVMFERLYNEFPGMFPRMFQKMQELKVSLTQFSEPYLSHIIYYFMFYAAGKNELANHFVVPPMSAINPKWIQEIEGRFNLRVVGLG